MFIDHDFCGLKSFVEELKDVYITKNIRFSSLINRYSLIAHKEGWLNELIELFQIVDSYDYSQISAKEIEWISENIKNKALSLLETKKSNLPSSSYDYIIQIKFVKFNFLIKTYGWHTIANCANDKDNTLLVYKSLIGSYFNNKYIEECDIRVLADGVPVEIKKICKAKKIIETIMDF